MKVLNNKKRGRVVSPAPLGDPIVRGNYLSGVNKSITGNLDF
jgi:hypothetical protein